MDGIIRTTIHCHDCSKNFVAELEGSIDGEHKIECPHCGHRHYRQIKGGQVTENRWGTGDSTTRAERAIEARSVWKDTVLEAKTSTVAWHIRERWLNRSDFSR